MGPAVLRLVWRRIFRRTIWERVIDATIAIIDNPEVTLDELMEIVPGPDFPTGALILGRQGSRSAIHKGRGSIVMRGRAHFEEIRKDRQAIIVTEIPYQVNKSAMIEKIAELVREKRIEGISDLRDESDRQGIRVVIELKRDANAEVILNQLYRFSSITDLLWCQHVGAEWWPARIVKPARCAGCFYRLPGTGDCAPDDV